ncbi:TlyA family rRNA (cytidine-2'-O)-methyltransferase [Halobacillus andaensis]|uniref:TlyA family rRNA (Cytidine-2'-O)-methyltransferase n=1 Tax=Halobacillus andaensis TaxID=1176239 RepID=A0A917AY36_HALAA|nr:TlyA family RNA methyltransferase [Halobacillus andaensis]MBP2003145.1 23S rRNA (cytidine1920-2'-O)/16S rRNA (cytidine1409-2'-O)-methyltransferase [Halobacillus andaensis]GGF08364.1 TlyA family rRNA (cytidine-2'-O)-methyltransferase [Halobacillus andaensis]
MGKKVRLDVLLVEKGLIETREKAKRTIMAGLVFQEQVRLDKPGVKIDENAEITIKGRPLPYVSRGGLKLEKALNDFNLNIQGKIMIDVGSSTGGFTDCALQNGVARSYAVDVGYNQLDWKLRNHEQVIVMERTNFRYMTLDDLKHGQPEFATIDVSFISLRIILPVLASLIKDGSDVVALIKPQFEAGREQVGKKGIVREPKVHKNVVSNILTFAQEHGYKTKALTFSPITGGDGNIEFLAHFRYGTASEEPGPAIDIDEIVKEAHDKHKK